MKFGVYVRSVGERTERLCLEACYQYIDPNDVYLLKNYFPSYYVYREMFIRALKSEYDWFLAIDADVILYNNWFKIMQQDIEHQNPKKVFKFTYLVDDYILEDPIDRGNHIYNNAFTKYALKELEKNIFISKLPMVSKKRYKRGRYLKPETSIRHTLREKYNLDNFLAVGIIGIHGAEQYLSEVFRRFVVRANRNPNYIDKYDFLRESNQEKLLQQGNIDKYVANLGWNYGVKHSISRIDARVLTKFKQILVQRGITERNELKKDLNWFYNKIDVSNVHFMSLISLLMTNYNYSEYITEAIESVLEQTSPEWELIIVDDASTDSSLEIIEPYLKDECIQLVTHDKTQGYAASLITAVENSSAEIIGIIDADDALHKDAVKIMIKAHQDNPDCGLIYSSHYLCDDDLKISGVTKWVGIIPEGQTNLHREKVSHFKTFKRSDYEKTTGFDPTQKKAVDRDIIYKLEEVTKLKFIDRPLYYYRRHEKGISQASKAKLAFIYDVSARCKAHNRRLNSDIPNITRKELAALFFKASHYYLLQNQPKKAKPLLEQAIKLNPLDRRYIKTYFLKIIVRGLFLK